MNIELYTRELSRQYPGLFVILLDQSSSMGEFVERAGHKETKAQMVTRHVNTIIQEMIDNAGVEEFDPGIRRKYAYLSVLGYNDTVSPLLSSAQAIVDIPTLAGNPRGEVPEIHEKCDRTGKVIDTFIRKRKFWITPHQGLNTNMVLAFDHARDVVANWLNASPEQIAPGMGLQRSRRECFPPVIINVTDGYFTKGGNPLKISEELRRMRTDNGNVLVFNCHFTIEDKLPCIFPKHVSEVQGIDPYGYAEIMFYMSSVIPEPLRQRAIRTMRRPIEEGARCVAYNASLEILIQFLRWGTLDVSAATGTGGA